MCFPIFLCSHEVPRLTGETKVLVSKPSPPLSFLGLCWHKRVRGVGSGPQAGPSQAQGDGRWPECPRLASGTSGQCSLGGSPCGQLGLRMNPWKLDFVSTFGGILSQDKLTARNFQPRKTRCNPRPITWYPRINCPPRDTLLVAVLLSEHPLPRPPPPPQGPGGSLSW